jgi:DNA invertase Pin-like site-specific DNA recombinase
VLIGYARVSTLDQDSQLQRDALKLAGVDHIFEERVSAVKRRPVLEEALSSLRPGSVLVVWKLDRLARSLRDLLTILERLQLAGAAIRSLTEPIDTATPAGMLMVQVLGAVAQFERSMIRERVIAGQRAARARGKRWGRPCAFTPFEGVRIAGMWRSGWFDQATLARMFGVSTGCIRDAIHKAERRGRWS